MSAKLYTYDMSGPCVSVYFTEAALGINLNHIEINIWKKEQFSSKFLTLNPQHSVPTLVDDDGTIVCDSHAINIYLFSKYGKDDSLYPRQHSKRALVHQRLFFNATVALPRVQKLLLILVRRQSALIKSATAELIGVYELLENFLLNSEWVAGDNLTLADFSLIPTITHGNYIAQIDFQKYPNMGRWIKNAEHLPFYEKNQRCLEMIEEFCNQRSIMKSVL